MVKVKKRNSLNVLSYRCRWGFLLSFLLFVFLSFFLKTLKDENFATNATKELGQLFSQRQTHLKDFLQNNQKIAQKILNTADFSTIFKKLEGAKGADHKKITDDLREVFHFYQQGLHYKNVFIVSSEGEALFELEENTFTPFTQLDGLESEKQRVLKNTFERVHMTLAPAYSEFIYDQIDRKPLLYLILPLFYEKTKQCFMIVEIDHERIYKITNNFEDLGKTGEIVLGKHVGNSVVLVAPTRKNKQIAFKSLVSLKSKSAIPIIRASQGIEGSGQFLDYLKDPIYAVWGFIPQLNLGMVVKKDIHELTTQNVLYPLLLSITIGLAVISFCLAVYGFLHVNGADIRAKGKQTVKIKKRLLQTLFWMSFLVLSLTFLYQNITHYQAATVMEKKEVQYLKIAKQQISHSLTNVESIAYSFAKDYQTKRIMPSQISKRLERDLKEHPELSGISVAYKPYQYKADQKLYAPFYYRSEQKIYETSLEDYTDYTKPFNQETPWYLPTLQEKKYWANPFHEKLSQQLVVSFSVPFYAPEDVEERKPLGVVTVYYPLSVIKKLMNYYDIGFSGYYFMLSEKGQYIYHPFDGYVQNQIKLPDLARTLESDDLMTLNKMMTSQKRGKLHFQDSTTGGTTWIHFMTLPHLKWVVGKQSSKEELLGGQFDGDTEKLVLFLEVIVTLLFLALVLGKVHTFTNPSIQKSFAMIAVILGLSNITLWSFIYENATKQQETDLKITDPLTLNVFLDEQMEKAVTLNEPLPTQVSTGFYIKALDIDKKNHIVSVNANLWQSVEADVENPEKIFGFMLPQAATVNVKEVQQKTFRDKTTQLWNLKTKLFQNFSYKYYPFDTHQLKVRIEPKNNQKNLIFVPDIESYRFIAPHTKPGLSKNIFLSGFTITQSYFSYQSFLSNTNFGFDDQSLSNAQTIINFVVQLKRNIIDSAVVYLCPLLLILFFLFVTLLALEKWAANAFGAVSALLFTLVLLQRALRISLGSNEIVYIEYLFFATYIMLLFSITYIVISFLNPKFCQKKSFFSTLVISTYWPILFSMWLFSTIYVFYLL